MCNSKLNLVMIIHEQKKNVDFIEKKSDLIKLRK